MLDQQMYVAEKVREFQERHWAGRSFPTAREEAARVAGWRRVFRLRPAVVAGRGLLQRLASA